MSADDSLSYSVAAQLIQVREGALAPRHNDDICLLQLLYIVRIEEMNALILLEACEVGVVGYVAKQYDCHVDLPLLSGESTLRERNGVLFFDVHVIHVRDDSKYRHATK